MPELGVVDRMVEHVPILMHVTVRGVVQGVGFRPFVFRLALRYGLKGWVNNTSSAVEIEVEGPSNSLAAFRTAIEQEAPPLARIDSVEDSTGRPVGYTLFEIRESQAVAGYQLVSPDVATCPDCLAEILDPRDRRYRYPFTNCTNCGPRFTIISDVPYDRPNTTMARFRMCEPCRVEYENVLDRRFHAQPNACPTCGPRAWIETKEGGVRDCGDPVAETARLLRSGSICALKGLGGFQLACRAADSRAVSLLRKRKGRPDKPLAVMMTDMAMVNRYCRVAASDEEFLGSPQAPILLLRAREGTDMSSFVAPGNKYLGVMLPYTPLHHLLLRDLGEPLVVTSGNVSEEPIAKDNDEARERLSGLADYLLLHDRDIYARYDDSVFATVGEERAPIRRARSYAPYPIKLSFNTPPLLATGAQEKNTFCLARDHYAFISQHIGDMENLDTLRHYEDTIALYKRLFRVEPESVAHDLHPDYLSTRYARRFEGTLPLVGVQHHHGHVAACMVDNGLSDRVIGVAFDGSGYGPDGTIWGGEFLLATYEEYQRVGHFEQMPLPGGEAAIRRPYRLAFGYLYALFGAVPDAPFLSRIDAHELEALVAQIDGHINTPATSSCGRLFDAVSALLDICGATSFEGQAAIALEMASEEGTTETVAYPFEIDEVDGQLQIRLKALFRALLTDVREGRRIGAISRGFHITVAEMIGTVAERISERTGIRDVVLSGGCFQNGLLVGLTLPLLKKRGLSPYIHRQVPCNDGGIALGQAAVASAAMRNR